MPARLKPVSEQVIVITGASSGIGLATAREAARRGARLVLAARNVDSLRDSADAMKGEVVVVEADVGRQEDVRHIAEMALSRFGHFDAWVNNAGVSIFGELEATPVADQRQLFETNYWGVVHGSLEAAKHLKSRGGAIINIGSVVSDRAIPLQGAYAASKHAVKGFTDALRMELEHAGAPISVTLVKPSAMATPFTEHAMNLMNREAWLPPPVYAPELVADAILRAAERPVRDVYVGGGGRLYPALDAMAPRLLDRLMERTMFKAQRGSGPAAVRDSLHAPGDDGRVRNRKFGYVREHSVYGAASRHPWLTAAALGGAAALVCGALGRRDRANGAYGRRSLPEAGELPGSPNVVVTEETVAVSG
jgi:short-subunit dehydrogenase